MFRTYICIIGAMVLESVMTSFWKYTSMVLYSKMYHDYLKICCSKVRGSDVKLFVRLEEKDRNGTVVIFFNTSFNTPVVNYGSK